MKKKFILIPVLLLCLSVFLCFASFAEAADEQPPFAEAAECTEPEINEGDKSESIFTLVYELLAENAEGIFSLLAFASTAIMSIYCRRSMIPEIRSAFALIKSETDTIKSGAAQYSEMSSACSEDLSERLSLIEKTSASVSERLDELKITSEELMSLKRESRRLESLMEAEIDMLRDIFMSASLPEFKKEAVEKRVIKMKEELRNEEL